MILECSHNHPHPAQLFLRDDTSHIPATSKDPRLGVTTKRDTTSWFVRTKRESNSKRNTRWPIRGGICCLLAVHLMRNHKKIDCRVRLTLHYSLHNLRFCNWRGWFGGGCGENDPRIENSAVMEVLPENAEIEAVRLHSGFCLLCGEKKSGNIKSIKLWMENELQGLQDEMDNGYKWLLFLTRPMMHSLARGTRCAFYFFEKLLFLHSLICIDRSRAWK